MNITSAKYTNDDAGKNIKLVVDDKTMFVPLDLANRHYAAIKKKHDDPDDSFTIQDAD